jgi:signal transduction histidine kinase
LTSVASAAALGAFHGDLHQEGDVVAICVLLLTAGTASVIADRARHRADDLETRLELEEELRRSEAERIHLREVRDSRARVLAAADDERRRVVRDLHDGAQQRLVHTVVTLKMARRAYDEGNDGLRPLVDEAIAQAERATEELRELARGILPSALTRGGLRAGVEALVTRIQMPVTVRVAGDRLPAAVEAPAYFLVAEALTNVLKHSCASHVDVSARVRDGVLHVQVSDNGVGGARPDGDGLLGLADRIATVNGALHVESPPGAGTRIAATIPVA